MRIVLAPSSIFLATVICAVTIASVSAVEPPNDAAVGRVRGKEFEIHFDTARPEAVESVEIWCTYDCGKTWRRFAPDRPQRRSPALFVAPQEGLCGLFLIIRDSAGASSSIPSEETKPHQWCFVDWTPPLFQLHVAEKDERFEQTRRIALKWSAYDANLLPRPIDIYYMVQGQRIWVPIELHMPNSGRYDWRVPNQIGGDVVLKVAVGDRGGHLIERFSESMHVDPVVVVTAVPTNVEEQNEVVEPRVLANQPLSIDADGSDVPEPITHRKATPPLGAKTVEPAATERPTITPAPMEPKPLPKRLPAPEVTPTPKPTKPKKTPKPPAIAGDKTVKPTSPAEGIASKKAMTRAIPKPTPTVVKSVEQPAVAEAKPQKPAKAPEPVAQDPTPEKAMTRVTPKPTLTVAKNVEQPAVAEAKPEKLAKAPEPVAQEPTLKKPPPSAKPKPVPTRAKSLARAALAKAEPDEPTPTVAPAAEPPVSRPPPINRARTPPVRSRAKNLAKKPAAPPAEKKQEPAVQSPKSRITRSVIKRAAERPASDTPESRSASRRPTRVASAVVQANTPAGAKDAAPIKQPETTVVDAARAERLYRAGTYYRLRGLHGQRGNLAVAALRFQDAVQANPRLTDARLDLGSVLFLQGKYRDAAETYSVLLGQQPNHRGGLKGMALVMVRSGQYAAAKNYLAHLVSQYPKDGNGWLDLGDLHHKTGDLKQARSHWSKAASIRPIHGSVVERARRRLGSYTRLPLVHP